MKFCSLGSGSKGNATLIESDRACVMIDCGFPLKHTLSRMANKGIQPEQLSAILVTHEHGDHINGVARLAKKYTIPVYLTQGTARSKKIDDKVDVRFIQPDKPFVVGDLSINPVTVPHDAREPCQFVLSDNDKSLGVLTDLGYISPHVQQAFSVCDALVLEANHDYDLLMNGSYPPSLKSRVAGDWGHLSNEQAYAFLRHIVGRLETVVLAHVSQQNNCSVKVKDLFCGFEEDVRRLHYATQDEGYDWLTL